MRIKLSQIGCPDTPAKQWAVPLVVGEPISDGDDVVHSAFPVADFSLESLEIWRHTLDRIFYSLQESFQPSRICGMMQSDLHPTLVDHVADMGFGWYPVHLLHCPVVNVPRPSQGLVAVCWQWDCLDSVLLNLNQTSGTCNCVFRV